MTVYFPSRARGIPYTVKSGNDKSVDERRMLFDASW